MTDVAPEVTDETLRAWALSRGRQAMIAIAGDNPRFRSQSKEEVVDWMLANDRAPLAESYRIETEALAHPKHNHLTRGIRMLGMCPACDRYHERATHA